MNTKMLKINKACSENWERMTPNEQSKFCTVCAKTVTDFSNATQQEIIDALNSSKGEICGRLTSSQLNKPIIEFKEYKEYKLPYSRKIAASLFLAASLTSVQANDILINNTKSSNPIVLKYINCEKITFSENSADEEQNPAKEDMITITGSVRNNITDSLLHHAKIEFFTLEKVYTCYSNKDGSYKLNIPLKNVQDKNIIRITYNDLISASFTDPNDFYLNSYREEQKIITKDEINQDFNFKALSNLMLLGGISFHQERLKPLYFIDGIKTNEKTFLKLRTSKYDKNQYSNFYFFNSYFSEILYGKEVKAGIYLYYSE